MAERGRLARAAAVPVSGKTIGFMIRRRWNAAPSAGLFPRREHAIPPCPYPNRHPRQGRFQTRPRFRFPPGQSGLRVAEQKAEASDTQAVVSDATAQALTQAPLALLGTLFTAPGGATTALKGAKTIGRNWPLLLLLAMVAALFWPAEETSEEAEVTQLEGKPNGSHPAETLH
jgi:hypothetical protein